MGVPDMAVPIRYALSWREEGRRGQGSTDRGPLNFVTPDTRNFPCRSRTRRSGMTPTAASFNSKVAVALS